MRRGLGGETETKTCATRGVVDGPHAASVRLDDGPADAKPHAGPVRLGSKESIEDLFLLLWRQPYAVVTDGHNNFLAFRSLRPDVELALPIRILHRFDAVDHEVHQHLLQLHAVGHDLGKICGEVHPDYYVVSPGLGAQKNDHLANNVVYVHELPLRSTFLEELADPADDFPRALCVFHDSHGSRARLFDVWSVAREPAQARISVGASCGDWLIPFVRKGSRQLSHRVHPSDLCEIRLRLTQSLQGLFRPLAFGHVD